MRVFIFLLFLLVSVQFSFAQLYVQDSLTPQQYVEKVLLGTGITVSNVTFKASGQKRTIGYFDARNTNLGYKKGLLLTTGVIEDAVGPNDESATSDAVGSGLPGDRDLDTLNNDPFSLTEDATILEFDFVPLSDTVKFNYIFSSVSSVLESGIGKNCNSINCCPAGITR